MNKALQWLAAAALLGLMGQAQAGDIYVCKGANGVNTYQNTPCPKPASQLQHSTYDASLARPGTPPADGVQQPVQQRELYRAPAAGSTDANPPPPAAPTGYQCTAGRRTWIQRTRCPTTYTEAQSVDVDGRTIDGQMVTGTGWINIEKPVQQQTMDRDTLCDQVRAGARIGQSGGSDASQAYERNKLKRSLCGG